METHKETKISRVDAIKDVYKQKFLKAIKKKKLSSVTNELTGKPFYFEHGFAAFIKATNPDFDFKLTNRTTKYQNTISEKSMRMISAEAMFNYLLNTDPTENKEYTQWIINQYTHITNTRYPYDHDEYDQSIEEKARMFFEDLGQLSDSISAHAKMKKMKTFKEANRDVANFKASDDDISGINRFMSEMFKYVVADGIGEDDDSVVTLTPQQIALIDKGEASLEVDGEQYMCFITHTRYANYRFGNATNWCTATNGGGKYSTMFDYYAKDGPLYVLIKKGCGSVSKVIEDPMSKLQFHFESDQFRDARDVSIKISDFLNKNLEIKEYFKKHVGRMILANPAYKNDNKRIIEFLKKLGYEDKIIDFLIDVQPTSFTFSGKLISANDMSRLDEIQSLKSLKFDEDVLTFGIPKSVFNLKNLESLDISNNKGVITLPDDFKKLTKLRSLKANSCDIQKISDVFTNMESLSVLYLNNNPNLTHVPDMTGTSIEQFSVARTSVINLPKMHNNLIHIIDASMSKITDFDVENLKSTVSICVQNSNIPLKRLKELNKTYNEIKTSPRGKILGMLM